MRVALAVVAALLVVSVISPVKWLCGREAEGQFPGLGPLTLREMTQYDMVHVAYVEQVKKLYTLFYEGYLTRPGHEKDEEEKFMRGLRTARKTKQRAQELIFKEPWEIIEPLGPTGRQELDKKK